MLHNYLIIALRNLRRYRSYTVANVAGLALGITCSLLIFLLVRFHLSMDTHHRQAERIYRVVTDMQFGELITTPGVPNPFGQAFGVDFPEIKLGAQVRFEHNNLLSTQDGKQGRKKFMLDNEMAFAEPNFFEIFDYQWLKGNKNALTEPYTAVLTAGMAKRVFGNEEVLGQLIRVDNEHDYRIAGLLADIPDHTAFRQEVFLSMASYWAMTPKEEAGHWGGVSSNCQFFMVLPENVQASQIEQGLAALVKKNHEDHSKWSHHLQALPDIYFDMEYGGDVPKTLLWALSIVGLFLLGTACINFINLATAQALNRSREVGVRKVLGSGRRQLFAQFLLETGLITLAALLISVLLGSWALPFVNELTHAKLALRPGTDLGLLAFLGLALLGVTFLAGAYPALVLAGFRPALALKGKINTQTLGGYSVRRGLVVVQFVICQVMMITAIVVSGQMDHIKNASLGFNTDAVVMLPVPKPDKTKVQALRQQLQQHPGVLNVSFAFDAPAGNTHNTTNCRFDNRQADEDWYIATRPGDEHYVETFGLSLVAGRNLQPSDTIREYLLNEYAVQQLGFSSPADVIGKRFRVWGAWAPVVGVVRNFNTQSLRNPIEPVVIMSDVTQFSACGVKIDLSNTAHTLASLEQTWNRVFPDEYYAYSFLDERIGEFYEMESALLSLTQIFCGIAILIGCLGLFGLVSFMAARKQKEIGIRKVLGATATQILAVFGREFFLLILMAFVVAAPLGWWAMNAWLEDYAYRITLGFGIFAATILATLLIAVLTVGAQSLKASLSPPAKSLRSE
ncbi:MAG: ABC transporter permease [Saprospiraceae bacterium]|nr:ABC transporter permease [Saprospiraceae bacterium]